MTPAVVSFSPPSHSTKGRWWLRFVRVASAGLSAGLMVSFVMSPVPARLSTEVAIYVSPNGSDNNPGTQGQPLADLSAAQNLVRTINQNMTSDITVYLEDGTYRLAEPLRFSPADSGTNGFEVNWTAAPGAQPIISGAVQVTGWTLTNSALNIWSAPVPATLRTRQVYVNGARAFMAASVPPVTLQRAGSEYLTSSSLMSHWRNPAGIDFVYPNQLSFPAEPICPVSSISSKVIHMAQPCWNNSNLRKPNQVGWGSGFLSVPSYIENAYELLSQPGQFYLDSRLHRLYYIPRPGEDMSTADVEAPALQTLVSGTGSAVDSIENVTFSNLQFSYATWLQPSTPQGFSEIQSNYTITGSNGYAVQGLCRLASKGLCPYGSWTKEPGNISFSYDQNLAFDNDRFIHLGGAGLNFDDGSRNDVVQGCIFTDVAGNGLEIGSVDLPNAAGSSQTSHIQVLDNHVYGIGVDYPGAVGILAGYMANSTIAHNQIDHVPYVAISIGWGGWLDKVHKPSVPNFSHDNAVSDNLIFDFMQVVKDGGGIYTQGILGRSLNHGLLVNGNVIHDQLDWGGALKADDGTTYVTYQGNVLYNDTYDWDGVHSDYRFHPVKSYDPELLKNNWWQQGDPNASDKGVILSGNHIIASSSQAPRSVMQNAGLQKQFHSLLSWQPESSSTPNPPTEVSILYALRGRAYVTWHPSYLEGSSPVTSYLVTPCRLGGPKAPGACIPMGPVTSVSASTFARLGYAHVSGLKDGRAYRFTVSAVNAAGASVSSIPCVPGTPVSYLPHKPAAPTDVWDQTGSRAVTVFWYRPRNDRGVLLLSRRHRARRDISDKNLIVLRYVVKSSTGQRYYVSGQQELIDTNTGSRNLLVIGNLDPKRKYRFSIAAINPAGAGPPARTGWIVVHS